METEALTLKDVFMVMIRNVIVAKMFLILGVCGVIVCFHCTEWKYFVRCRYLVYFLLYTCVEIGQIITTMRIRKDIWAPQSIPLASPYTLDVGLEIVSRFSPEEQSGDGCVRSTENSFITSCVLLFSLEAKKTDRERGIMNSCDRYLQMVELFCC